MTTVIKALSNKTRVKILEILNAGEAPHWWIHQEVNKEYKLVRPTISAHLKELCEANLVTYIDNGRNRFYSINTEKILMISLWFKQFEKIKDNEQI